MPRTAFLPAAVILAALLAFGAKPFAARHFLQTQRNLDDITRITAEGGHQGDCDQCHTLHGQGPVVYGHALLGPDQNSLCERCHDTPWAGGSFAGTPVYVGSAHADGSGTVWPGPDPASRTEPDAAGKCLNCHDAHGLVDDHGLIPALGVLREEKLCLTCHDGNPAVSNIAVDLAKPFRHPAGTWWDRHKGPGEADPADFGAQPTDRRHAECVDCHNPHVANVDRGGPPPAPELSRSMLGVSRLLVQNGAAGSAPIYTFLPASDTLTTPRAEYQVCFKCHSNWTTQPTGQTDLGIELNPSNASYHPVEAAGRDAMINAASFVPGWNASSLTGCGDCHGSDFEGAPRGPHGSSNRYILRAPYEAAAATRMMAPNEVCFSCHSFDVYANPSAADAVLAASRFNAPGETNGHAAHVGQDNVPCYACHVTHGAATQPHLLVTGRLPGLSAYTESPTGGTCQSSCHAPQSYTINYGR